MPPPRCGSTSSRSAAFDSVTAAACAAPTPCANTAVCGPALTGCAAAARRARRDWLVDDKVREDVAVMVNSLGSVYIWNAHALPRERPLARRVTPRIPTYSQGAQRGERPFSWQPQIKKNHSTGMPEIARMAASLVACPPRGLPPGRLARPNGAPPFLPYERFRAFACAFHM